MATLAAVDIEGKAIEDGDYTFTQNLCRQFEEFGDKNPDGRIPNPVMSSKRTHEFGLRGCIAQSESPVNTCTAEHSPSPQPVANAKEQQRPKNHGREQPPSAPTNPRHEASSPQINNSKVHPTSHGAEISPFTSTTSLKDGSWGGNVNYYVGPHDVDLVLPLDSPLGTPSSAPDSRCLSPVGSASSRGESAPIKKPNARSRTTEGRPYPSAQARTNTAPYPRTSQTSVPVFPIRKAQTFDDTAAGRRKNCIGEVPDCSLWKPFSTARPAEDPRATSWNSPSSKPSHWLYDD
ncbi:hypothetical protein B0T21DRAFT_380665 [Apiosordaria backusii]|uniref:Uncharacterized protein n=1 Tax=Apiosordaria backusii TaxID=314023 RepID=A0AA40ERU6_9PEZI|nr:hypothetical protein B0T21DRAFT_380665 [Apiosordaria backusii]